MSESQDSCTEAAPKESACVKPFLLTEADIERVRAIVSGYLPPHFDREFIVDTIILNAWLKDVKHISVGYIRNKCISAWRQRQREVKHNEGAIRSIAQTVGRTIHMLESRETLQEEPNEIADIERKMLVEEAVGKLSSFERKLIWMRYYDDQTLEEISSRTRLAREKVQQALKVAIYKMRVHLA